MSESYATLEDLQTAMGPSWDETQSTLAETLIAVTSAGLRRIFKAHGMNLNDCVANGYTEAIIVTQTVVDIVSRGLQGSSSPLSGDFSQMSQSAGGYSISVSPTGSGLYLKREQARWLGLPQLTTSSIKLWS